MTEQSWRPSRRRHPSQDDASAARRSAGFGQRMRRDWWWIAILMLCGSFQIYRGAPIDGVFFLAAGLALLADAAGWLRWAARYPLLHLRLVVQLVLGALAVAVIAFAPQFGVAALITVSTIGATALLVAWRDEELPVARAGGRDAPPRRPVRRAAVLWAAAGVALCLWELASFFLAMPSPAAESAHPPLSDLIDPIVANPLGRAGCAALWLLAGAALLRRGRGLPGGSEMRAARARQKGRNG